jgi:hypothetical protein
LKLLPDSDLPAKPRRIFVAWIVTVAACAVAVLIDHLTHPPHPRIFGMEPLRVLTPVTYVTAIAMCGLTFSWFRATTRRMRRIGVWELRQRARRLRA